MAEDTFLKSEASVRPQQMQASSQQFQASQYLGSSIGASAQNFMQTYQAQQEMALRGAIGQEQMLTEQLRREEIQQKMMMVSSGTQLRLQEEQLRGAKMQNDLMEKQAQQMEIAGAPGLSASEASSLVGEAIHSERAGHVGMLTYSGGSPRVTDVPMGQAETLLNLTKTGPKQPSQLDQLETITNLFDKLSGIYGNTEQRDNLLRLLKEKTAEMEAGGGAKPTSVVPVVERQEQTLDAAAASVISGLSGNVDFANGILRIMSATGASPDRMQFEVTEFIKGLMMEENPPSAAEIKKLMTSSPFWAYITDKVRGG